MFQARRADRLAVRPSAEGCEARALLSGTGADPGLAPLFRLSDGSELVRPYSPTVPTAGLLDGPEANLGARTILDLAGHPAAPDVGPAPGSIRPGVDLKVDYGTAAGGGPDVENPAIPADAVIVTNGVVGIVPRS